MVSSLGLGLLSEGGGRELEGEGGSGLLSEGSAPPRQDLVPSPAPDMV